MFDRLFIKFNASATGASCFHSNDSGSTGQVTVRNSILYQNTSDSVGCVNASNTTFTIQNCTIIQTGTNSTGINASGSGSVTVTNCYVSISSGTPASVAYAGTMTRTNCAHSSSTSYSGSTASIANDTSNFVNVTLNSEDYHLVSGASSTILTGGTDLSGTFTNDVDGDTRSVPFSIGADQRRGGVRRISGIQSGGLLNNKIAMFISGRMMR